MQRSVDLTLAPALLYLPFLSLNSGCFIIFLPVDYFVEVEPFPSLAYALTNYLFSLLFPSREKRGNSITHRQQYV